MTDARRQPEDPTAGSTAPGEEPGVDPGERAARTPPPAGEQAAPADHVAHAQDARDDGESAPSGELDLESLADSDPRSRAELIGAIVQIEQERDDYLDDLRRSHADFENYRKRVMRDGAAQREAGKATVAEALLEVIDDLDRTVQAAEGSSDSSLAKGVELVAGKLAHALQGVGVQRVDATGVAFDPSVHEAVQQRPADEPTEEPRVAQVLRPGYTLGERTLRAAMVVVEQ